MSETVTKTIPDLQAEYQNLALKAGDIQYQLFNFTKELDLVNNRMRDINLEAAGIMAKDKEAAEAAKADATAPVDSGSFAPGEVIDLNKAKEA